MASDDQGQRRAQSPFERHLQTILSGAAVAGCIAIGTIVWNIPAQNATVTVKLERMQSDIEKLSTLVGDRYTRTDAERDAMKFEKRLNAIEQRQYDLEKMMMRRDRTYLKPGQPNPRL